MSVLPLYHLPALVLREKAKKVRNIDASIRKLIDDMIETMHAVDGIGLAAPQVGVPLRVIVIEVPQEKEENLETVVLINPEFVKKTGERVLEERCLSIPGYYGEVKRAESVVVKGRDRNGKEIKIKAQDVLAHALEHEIDHLNGTLYVDHLKSADDLKKTRRKQAEDAGEA